MSALGILLGLAPGTRILVLGAPDREIEAALAHPAGSEILLSGDGHGVPRASMDVAVLGRGAASVPATRRPLVTAAARALVPGGIFAAEFPNRLAALSKLLLAHETLPGAGDGRGGLGYGSALRLLRDAGFARVSGFLCLPGLADPQVLLPLDGRRALAFHFATPFFLESPARRMLRRFLATAAAGGFLPALAPAFSLIATRSGESGFAEAA